MLKNMWSGFIVHVFLAEASSWRWNGAHQKRPLSSVVLEPGVKDMLIADAKDFLASEAWYADRGVSQPSVTDLAN
jgi:mitochondrial chaperone BCS1